MYPPPEAEPSLAIAVERSGLTPTPLSVPVPVPVPVFVESKPVRRAPSKVGQHDITYTSELQIEIHNTRMQLTLQLVNPLHPLAGIISSHIHVYLLIYLSLTCTQASLHVAKSTLEGIL